MKNKHIPVALGLLILSLSLTGCSEQITGTVENVTSKIGRIFDGIFSKDKDENTDASKDSSDDTDNGDDDLSIRIPEEKGLAYLAYNQLSEPEKVWYQDMKNTIENCEAEISLSSYGIKAGLSDENLDRVFRALFIDNPQFFYVNGYSYTKTTSNDAVKSIVFVPKYIYPADEITKKKELLEKNTADIVTENALALSDYEKVKYVYETIVRNTNYDPNADDNQNILSVINGHASVCLGYAKATQYLLNKLGVECTLISGYAGGEGHAWNIVRVDTDFYHVDTTWGEISLRNAEIKGMPEVSFDYLCVSDEIIYREHVSDSDFTYPECSDMAANYYVQENLVFSSYNKETFANLFKKCVENGQRYVAFMSPDPVSFNDVLDAVCNDIFDYVPGKINGISYFIAEDVCSATFVVTK